MTFDAVALLEEVEQCAWCEDWGLGMDPEPCPRHHSCLAAGGHCSCPPHGAGQCPDCTCSGAAE